ncbi:MAG: hypothetical protein RR048_03155, partial [Oscillospiraceae bacterium]
QQVKQEVDIPKNPPAIACGKQPKPVLENAVSMQVASVIVEKENQVSENPSQSVSQRDGQNNVTNSFDFEHNKSLQDKLNLINS